MRALPLAAAILALLSSGCAREPVLNVRDAYVRLPAAAGNPGAAYFMITGGPTANRLLTVSSPVVIRTELHESMSGQGGMMTMKPIEAGIEIPAGGAIEFKPGGKHVMMYNINPGIVPPRTLQMNFTFANGERITVNAEVKRAGDE